MSSPRIDPRQTVNDVLLKYPAAISALNAFGIDACCGGAKSLSEVAERHKIDLAALLRAIEEKAA